MQVFKIEPRAPYTYGAAIIAAEDSYEAIDIYCSDEFRNYKYDEFGCKCSIIVGLYYNTDNSCLIFDTISSE